jgi:hypothetical protein
LLPTLTHPQRLDLSTTLFSTPTGSRRNFLASRGWGKRVLEAEPMRAGGFGKIKNF